MSNFWSTVGGKIVGTVLATFIISATIGIWAHLAAFWVLETTVAEIVKEEQSTHETLEDIKELLGDISTAQASMKGDYEELKEIILTPELVGRATVGRFGDDVAFVQINEGGYASMYLKAETVMVTCKIDGLRHTLELPVRGSFVNRDDPGHLLIFSKQAANDIGVTGLIRDVIVGPVK